MTEIPPREPGRPWRPRVPAPSMVPPAYPASRLEIPAEIALEFGIVDVPDLVDLVNRERAKASLPPLAQGSYPTNRQRLRPLVVFLRRNGLGGD